MSDSLGDDKRRDDLDDWLQALAGRPSAHTADATLREAQWLRDAMRRWPAPGDVQAAPHPHAEAAAEAALLARAAQAGLLPADGRFTALPWYRRWFARTCSGCAARGQRLRAWFGTHTAASGLAVAAAALLVVGVLQLPPPAAPARTAPLLRGAQQDGSWLLQAADPRALRDAWATRLQATGASVRRYERLGRFGLDAEWPTPPHRHC